MTTSKQKLSNHDIHTEVTDQIIALLDKVNIDDYQSPFTALAAQGLPMNPTTNNYYNGINILALWLNQLTKNYSSNEWATFKQWKDKGAKIKKGEKGSRIIFYKPLIKTEENESGKSEEVVIPMLRLYTVFNATQVDGYESKLRPSIHNDDLVERNGIIDAFCKATHADIRHVQGMAFYNLDEDYIQMPDTHLFLETKDYKATQHYYATLFHELTHWTGAKHRLDRLNTTRESKTKAYAFEELVAELGSAFLCAKFNIEQSLPDNHAIYIKSWLEDLKNDKNHIFKAAAQASKAFEYLDELTMKPEVI